MSKVSSNELMATADEQALSGDSSQVPAASSDAASGAHDLKASPPPGFSPQRYGDTVAGAAAFTDAIAKGLQALPEHLDPIFTAAEKLIAGSSSADICCALGTMKRSSDQFFDLEADKRHITIAGVLARASYFAKSLPQLERALSKEKEKSKEKPSADEGQDQPLEGAQGIMPGDMHKQIKCAPQNIQEKFSEIQALLRHVEEMEQCMIHEASAIRAQMVRDAEAPNHRIAASATALAQLTLFLPLSLTSTALMDTIARLEQSSTESYVHGVAERDFFLMDAQPGLLQRLTDIRLIGWSSVALGSVLLNMAVAPELVMGLCGMGSLLVGGATVKNRADKQAHVQNELTASANAHTQAGYFNENNHHRDSMLQKLARFVAAEDEVFQQHERELGMKSALAHFGDEIVTPDAAPEFQNPRDLTDICGLFEQARDLAYWMIELEAGTTSPRPDVYGKMIESTSQKPAHVIGQMLDTLIEGVIELDGSIKRDEAFHLKTAMQRFRPMIGFTYERQEIMRTFDAALNRVNRLLASDLDRVKYDCVESKDEANVALWSTQDIQDIEHALAQGRVRLNSAVLPTARDDLKTELSNHVFAALRHKGASTRRGTLAKLIGRVVTASGTRFDEAMRTDLIARLKHRHNFDASQLIDQAKTRIQWSIRGGRFIVSCQKSFQWNDPASGEAACSYDCVREMLFDIHSARFDGEFYHVG